MGVTVPDSPPPGQMTLAGDWAVSAEQVAAWRQRLPGLVEAFESSRPLEPGMPVPAVVQALGLPDPEIVPALVRAPLQLAGGRLTGRTRAVLPPVVEAGVQQLERDLADDPFRAPTADRLRELGLDAKALAAAAKAGRLLRLADGVVLMPGAEETAVQRLTGLPQPFTTSQARVALGTTRRVALPLLGHLDRTGRTLRHPDDRRSLRDSTSRQA
jgi:selenocysteine-specific elongation factor